MMLTNSVRSADDHHSRIVLIVMLAARSQMSHFLNGVAAKDLRWRMFELDGN
jgi:hypothetical protein